MRSQAIAEEIVQDLFFAIWLRRETLEASSLRGYLFRTAHNRALHHLRHQSIVQRIGRLVKSRPEVAGTAVAGASTDARLYADERRRLLRAAIDRLPPRSRLALVLRLDHEMSDREVAEAMGISSKGVEKLLAIAKRHLRDMLGDASDALSEGDS